ncbi:MAG: hypothetical protein SFX18_16200 [Pirellulales bacterium]|nr:hypothetical protein [Pirellulales bacterium]
MLLFEVFAGSALGGFFGGKQGIHATTKKPAKQYADTEGDD